MPNALHRAASYAARPLLMHPEAARSLAARVLTVDPRAFERRAGPFAAIRALGRRLAGSTERVEAFDDEPFEVPTAPAAYTPLWLGEPDACGEWGWSLKDGVALLQIDSALDSHGSYFCGTWWHGYDTLEAAFDEMDADSRVRAIFVRQASPGGVVTGGLPALAAKILARRQASGGAKPIWSYCDLAASADYWLASGSDRIVAPKVGLIGSIGAVMVHYDYTAALDKDGVAVTAIEFPDGKTDGAWFKALSDQARADLQAEVTECASLFIDGVAAARPQLTSEAIIAMRAGCFMGQHSDPTRSALDLGLIDAVMNERDAFEELRASVAQPATSSPAAIAASPAPSARAGGAPAAAQESEMKSSAVLAITGDKTLTADEKVKRLAALAEDQADKPEDGEDGEDGDGEDGDGNDDRSEAPRGEGDPAKDGEDDGEPEMNDAKTAASILDLPEAKGREALARKLAFKKGMTVEGARELLAAAGKTGTLADRMHGRDPLIGANGGKGDDTGSLLVADAKARRAARSPQAA